MAKFPRFMPGQSITGSQINMILDMLDGGAYTSQGTSAVSGSQAGGSGSGSPPASGGNPPVGGSNYPSTPSGLGGSAGIDNLAVVNNGYVQLTWTANPGGETVMEYDIQYRKGADATYTFVKIPGGSTATKISNLFPGFTYQFSIRAVNGSNNSSPWSAEIGISITADTVAPLTPTGLTAYSAPHGAFIRWNANSEADLQGYLLQYSLDAGVTWNVVNSTPMLTGSTQWTNPNTPNNTNSNVSVQFKIAAQDFSGNTSAYSTPVTATTGGLSFAELLVGNLTALGTITGAGGITTRTGGTGAGVDIVQSGISGYLSNNTKTFNLDTTTGNLTISGNAAIGGATNTATLTAGTIQTASNVLTAGGAMMDGSGIQVLANTSTYVPAGTRVWYANVNGQFLSAQYYPIYTGYTPVDASYPVVARFNITSDIVRLVKVTISFYMDSFKVGQQTTASTTTASGGDNNNHAHTVTGQSNSNSVTSTVAPANTTGHAHDISVIGSSISTDNLVWDTSYGIAKRSAGNVVEVNGASFVNVDNHTHSVAAGGITISGVTSSAQTTTHTHNIPNLTVQSPTGLYNAGGASGVHIQIYNPAGTLVIDLGPYAGGSGTFVTDVDVTSLITSTGWWKVYFTSAGLGGIEAQINIKAIVQAI